jgi:hypothetical protein
LAIYQSQLNIALPDGSWHECERVITSRNQDSSRTMRAIT